MVITIAAIGIVLFISLAIQYLVIRIGNVRNSLDKQSLRNVHEKYTPRVGGIGIILSFAIGVTVLAFGMNQFTLAPESPVNLYCGILGAALILFLLGIYDDSRNVSYRWKLLLQLLAAELLVGTGTLITSLDFGIFGILNLGVLAVPFTLLFIIGMINATNLVDGLDGLACGIGFFALAVSVFFISRSGDLNLARGFFVLMIAMVGFLAYNFHPAKAFLGDAGSLTLGMFIAVGVIHAFTRPSGGIATPAFILPVFIPLLDTGTSILRRFISGMGLFDADRDHIHHRILQRTNNQLRTVILIWIVSASLGVSSILLMQRQPLFVLIGVLSAALSISYLFYISGIYILFRPRYVLDKLRRDRLHNKRLRLGLHDLIKSLEKQKSLWEVNHLLVNLVSMLGCSSFSINFENPRGVSSFSWERSDAKFFSEEHFIKDEFPILHGEREVGRIKAEWLTHEVEDLFEKRLLTEKLAHGIIENYQSIPTE